MSLGATPKATEPCGHYCGNVCTGFGARAVCMWCGWDRSKHPDEIERIKALWPSLRAVDGDSDG